MAKDLDEERPNALYAIPCVSHDENIFFVTFNTKCEKEALRLASCVQGKKGRRALVIITDAGEIFNL